MKILFVCFSLALLFLAQPILAQQDPNQFLIREHIKQSEKQKKTGIGMLGAGVGAVVIGSVLIGATLDGSSDFVDGTIAFLLVAGGISTLVSIPILISSASNGRKAGKLSIGLGQTQALQAPGFPPKAYPTIGFSLPLNAQKR